MIKVFRTNGVLQIAIIAFAVVAIWAGGFIWPEPMDEVGDYGPLYTLLMFWFGDTTWAWIGVGLAITLVEGYLLNRLLYSKGLIPLNSLMPMLLYVIFMGIGGASRGLTPAMVTNLWIVLALISMMPKEGMIKTEGSIFNSGLLCGLAALTWVPGLAVVIPISLGQVIYKMYNGREWAVGLLGLFAPIIIFLTVAFMIDEWGMVLEYIESVGSRFGLSVEGSWDSIVETSVVWLFAVVATIGALVQMERKTISQRIHGMVLLTVLIYGVVAILYESVVPVDAQPLALVLAGMGSVFFMEKRKNLWIYDVILGIIFMVSLLDYIV